MQKVSRKSLNVYIIVAMGEGQRLACRLLITSSGIDTLSNGKSQRAVQFARWHTRNR
jgi:hypothetical protein